MGGTGPEPVTPSLSIGAAVGARSLRCAQTAWLSRNVLSTARFSERERTLILATLATRNAANELGIAADITVDGRLDIGIADTVEEQPGHAEELRQALVRILSTWSDV